MDKIFLQIFNTAITAGWLVLAVLVARLLLKKAPAWIKCALWAIVAVRLVWPFSWESVLSLLPSKETIPQSQLYVAAPQVNTGIGSLNAAINPGFSQAFQAEPLNNSLNPLQVASFVAGWVWVLGVVLLLGYALISYLRLWRRVRVSAPLEAGVYLCDHISSPFILGIVRPRIYLPSGLPCEKWEPILAHERAHLKRWDHWWKPLGFLLLTVFWFHPLLWVAYILLCRDVELACDERVIKDFSAEEKQAYSNTLLECSLPQKWITACPLAFGETGVKQRIKAVLNYREASFWIILVAALIGVVLMACFLTDPMRPAQGTAGDQPGPAEVWQQISQFDGMETGEFRLAAFPKDTFQWNETKLEVLRGSKTTTLVEYIAIHNIAAVDLDLDGYPELCATVETEDLDEHVWIYDLRREITYTITAPKGENAYYLYVEHVAEGYIVMCAKYDAQAGKVTEAGRLIFDDATPAIKVPSLHLQSGEDVTVLFSMNHPDSAHQGQVELKDFPGVSISWYYRPNVVGSDRPVLVEDDKERTLFADYPGPMSLYLADVTGDGKQDLCADIYFFFSGLPSFNAVCVYDYANDRYYLLGAQKTHMTQTDHYLRIENGKLVCDELTVNYQTLLATGTLCIEGTGDDAKLVMKPFKTYDLPRDYVYGTGLNRVTLHVIHEGSAWLSFGFKPDDGIYKSGSLQGTYEEKGDLLYFHTENRATYVFGFEGENLVFVAKKSDKLPEYCVLPDGAVLKVNLLFG